MGLGTCFSNGWSRGNKIICDFSRPSVISTLALYTNVTSVTMHPQSRASSLRTHLKTHSGEKTNKCNQCDYACSDPDNLRKHLKIHNGEKSKKCNLCDFAPSKAGSLRRHFKTHSGEKTNKCNQCDYVSSRDHRQVRRRFEDAFENTRWRKVKQMQPM